MEHTNTDIEQYYSSSNHNYKDSKSISWRRDKVQELASQGNSQRAIASILKIGVATVNGDIKYLRQQARENIREYIEDRLPHEYDKCMVGLEHILKQSWDIVNNTSDIRLKLQAMSLINECISHKCDLLDNATVIDSALRFVESNKPSSKNDEQTEPDTEVCTNNQVF